MHFQDERNAIDTGDRRGVANEIEIIVQRPLIAFVALARRSTWPSAVARTTASAPILLPAPGRLSMINGWPSRSDSHRPIRRAMMSIWPPGGKPTTKRTGRVG
jgi:hypothetical protein